jgi:hypothetical protein
MGSNLKPVGEVVEDLYRSVMVHSNSMIWKERIREALQAREDDRQQAYHERNALVAFLSKVYPSHLARHPDSDESWDREWMTIVCIHMTKLVSTQRFGITTWSTGYAPVDQLCTLTWHVHDNDVPLFGHLQIRDNDWDGSSTADKYERLRRLP